MSKRYLLLFLFLYISNSYAQVGINTDDPKASLDIESSSRTAPAITDGLLIPRGSALNFAITPDQDGMLYYLDTNFGVFPAGLYQWRNDGLGWRIIPIGATSEWADDPFGSIRPTDGPGKAVNIGSIQSTLGLLNIFSTLERSVDIYTQATNARGISISNQVSAPVSFSQDVTAIRNVVDNNSPTEGIAIENDFDIRATSAGTETGMVNNFSDTGLGKDGVRNIFRGTAATIARSYGLNNETDSTTDNYTGELIGVHNDLDATVNNNLIGIENNLNTRGTGAVYGVNSVLSTSGTAALTGESIILSHNTGTGASNVTKGLAVTVDPSVQGDSYAIQATDTDLTNGYAAFLTGRVSVGTTTADNYILPTSRGTAGQVLISGTNGSTSWGNSGGGAAKSIVRADLNTVNFGMAGNAANADGYRKINFNNDSIDSKNEFDSVLNFRFTASVAGVYEVQMQYHSLAEDNTGVYGIAIYKNGTLQSQSEYNHQGDVNGTSTNSVVMRKLTDYISLNAGEYIEFYGKYDDTTNFLDGFSGKSFVLIKQL